MVHRDKVSYPHITGKMNECRLRSELDFSDAFATLTRMARKNAANAPANSPHDLLSGK
jgi:hypothetical protein